MAINRVDVQGTFIRQDVAQLRQDQENRAYADMTSRASQFEREAEEHHMAVTGTEAYEAADEKYDASEEGKNKHLIGNRRKNAGKKKEAVIKDPEGILIGADGKPLYGSKRSAFDLKI